ncbi:hypothetical protein [Vibrio echinoideorum]
MWIWPQDHWPNQAYGSATATRHLSALRGHGCLVKSSSGGRSSLPD